METLVIDLRRGMLRIFVLMSVVKELFGSYEIGTESGDWNRPK
jgi:hypothetical protein